MANRMKISLIIVVMVITSAKLLLSQGKENDDPTMPSILFEEVFFSNVTGSGARAFRWPSGVCRARRGEAARARSAGG